MKLKIKDKTFPVEMMITPEELGKGMMNRSNLDGTMGFKLKKGIHSFWMKDCLIPLDIIFVLNNKITKIFRNCEPCNSDDCETYQAMADYVFEFPSGTCEDFNEGDKTNLYLGTKFNN
jgi:uncharacterized membrane protein (UPF0127 family)